MTVIGKLNKLTIRHKDRMIVSEAIATIDAQARIAVIGANGSGKSSLLEAISSSEYGLEWIGSEPDIIFMEQEVKNMEQDGFNPAAAVLEKKWGIPEERTQLSGGELMKIRIVRALSEKADLYLLDEPTNHLDAESLEMLADELKKIEGTVIFVSHDRYFIDEVATQVWEVEDHKLTVYEGNYSASRKEKEHHRLTRQRKYDKQQAKIAMVESQMVQLQSWSDKAHRESTKKGGAKEYFRMKAKKKDVQIRSKRQRLQAELEQDRIEQPKEETRISFALMDAEKKGRRIIELKDAGKSFGERKLFEGVNFTIQHGERVGLLGGNGTGKSTLLKMVLGMADYTGEVWLSEGVEIGYLSQDVYDLPEEKTPAELFYAETFEEAGRIRNLMDHLGFEKVHWEQLISDMSMGERVKLKLMKFMLDGCNVLLLDEPTNHLDLPSREELERALASFGGTMLIATHDRYFMEKLSTKLLVFKNQGISKYEGNYMEWLERGTVDEQVELLQLETERQEVLGKLSFINPESLDYKLLDKRFKELTAVIQSLAAGKR